MNTLATLALILSLIAIAGLYYMYQAKSSESPSPSTETPGTVADQVYLHAHASAAPQAALTPMPKTSWNIVAASGMSMNDDGLVTLPYDSVYTFSASQDNPKNASSLGFKITLPDGTVRFYRQSAPSTGLGTSALTNTISMYCTKGSTVAPVYQWPIQGTNVTGDAQTIFTVVRNT